MQLIQTETPVHIATVTSNTQGTFGYTWTPTIPGQYTITATFAGDDSYGYSSAGTYATVVAPTTTPTRTATTQPSNLATTADLMTYIVRVGIAIIIAIAIVGALILRKKNKKRLKNHFPFSFIKNLAEYLPR